MWHILIYILDWLLVSHVLTGYTVVSFVEVVVTPGTAGGPLCHIINPDNRFNSELKLISTAHLNTTSYYNRSGTGPSNVTVALTTKSDRGSNSDSNRRSGYPHRPATEPGGSQRRSLLDISSCRNNCRHRPTGGSGGVSQGTTPFQMGESKFTVTTAYYGIAVKPGNYDLLQWVNTWVFVNKNNGVLAKIYLTHTGVKLVELPTF